MGCVDCPIRGTHYCHKVNPMAKKYTRSEKTPSGMGWTIKTKIFHHLPIDNSPTMMYIVGI